MQLSVEIDGQRWRADTTRPIDLSIPLQFDGPQPVFFGAPSATAEPLQSGSFIGDVSRGGTVNCARYSLIPHCNGTHTECAGHITSAHGSIRHAAKDHLLTALLLSVTPEATDITRENSMPPARQGDRLVTRRSLELAHALHPIRCNALVIRTLPNGKDKLSRNHDLDAMPPYFSAEAMHWIVEQDIRHLVVDLPSIDRAADEGRLTAHRLFWGIPPGSTRAEDAQRPNATITELAYMENAAPDGLYVLNLQVAPFDADAAPSRPILYPLVPM
jgi:arylformamidase